MAVVLAGLLTGLSLIVAIGAQNAYLLRLGLSRAHVGLAVTICAAADVALIVAGVAGVGRLTRSFPGVLEALKWIGVAYLSAYALHSFWKARRRQVLVPGSGAQVSARAVAATMAAFTFLNPHVYLDTVLLLGSLANQYGGRRWLFAAGASAGSILWFSALGFGARAAAPVMARPGTWRVLDVGIGVVMLAVAVSLATTSITS